MMTPPSTITTDVHTKTNADCRLCSASVIYSADVIGEIAQKNSQPKYIWQLTNLNHFRCNFCSRSFANPPLNNPAQYQICVAFVILNLWSMCALRLTQNHKVQFCLAGLSDFCISMQLFLVAIKVPILYPTCKISVFSVATSFSVN